jgi:hypothetical protein
MGHDRKVVARKPEIVSASDLLRMWKFDDAPRGLRDGRARAGLAVQEVGLRWNSVR